MARTINRLELVKGFIEVAKRHQRSLESGEVGAEPKLAWPFTGNKDQKLDVDEVQEIFSQLGGDILDDFGNQQRFEVVFRYELEDVIVIEAESLEDAKDQAHEFVRDEFDIPLHVGDVDVLEVTEEDA